MHIGAEGNSVATDKDRMSDDEAGQEDSEVTPPRRTSKLKMAIGALVVVGCAGAGAFVSLGTNLLGGGMTSTTSAPDSFRSEEHTSELQSLMRISYAVFCLKKKKKT